MTVCSVSAQTTNWMALWHYFINYDNKMPHLRLSLSTQTILNHMLLFCRLYITGLTWYLMSIWVRSGHLQSSWQMSIHIYQLICKYRSCILRGDARIVNTHKTSQFGDTRLILPCMMLSCRKHIIDNSQLYNYSIVAFIR